MPGHRPQAVRRPHRASHAPPGWQRGRGLARVGQPARPLHGRPWRCYYVACMTTPTQEGHSMNTRPSQMNEKEKAEMADAMARGARKAGATDGGARAKALAASMQERPRTPAQQAKNALPVGWHDRYQAVYDASVRDPEEGSDASVKGLVQSTRARSTGTVIEVLDRRDDGEGWETICVDHGGVCTHDTRALAVSFASAPEEWCPTCIDPDDHYEVRA
jgi:hypothetical protein